MENLRDAIAILEIARKVNANDTVGQSLEPFYGGYENRKGRISLFFAAACAYQVNLQGRTIRQGPFLSPGAQANYDAVEPGEPFLYANTEFLRLGHEQIAEICASGAFQVKKP